MTRASDRSGSAIDERRKGVQAAVVAYLVWGLLTLFWKQLQRFDPFEIIAWRVMSASVVMAGVVTIRGRWSVLGAAVRRPVLAARVGIAAVLLTCNWTGYVWAVTNDRVLEAALGYFMAPLATMVLGVTLLGEPASRLQQAALGFAATAVVVLSVSYGRPPWVALVIAASWSMYGLLKRQVPLSPVESLAGEVFMLLVPAVVVVVAMAGRTGSIPTSADAGEWILVALTGVATATPLLLFAIAAQRVPFTLLGALQYLVPTINLVLGWIVYDESMPAVRLVGFGLVWIALVAVTIDQARAAAPGQRSDVRAMSPTVGH